MRQQQCPARYKLSCGCCATVQFFECDLPAGHKGDHYEEITAENEAMGGLRYKLTWAAEE